MKKITFLIIWIIFCWMMFCQIPSFAACDYFNLCPKKSYGLSSKMGQAVSRGIGATSLSEKIAQARIRDELKKATRQHFDVYVKSYSFQDFIHGRFKSIIISGKNLDIEGAHISSLELKTLCNFNYVQFNKSPVRFKENLIVGFTMVISDNDLMQTMKSNGYLDKLNCVNVEGCGITFFKLSGADIEIKNNKLFFTVRVTSQLLLAKPLDIKISTDLKVEDGRIVFTKVDLNSLPKGIDLKNVAYRLNAINPLTFSLDVLENKNTKMCIKDVKIVGDKITIKGNIFIPKNS